MCFKFYLGNFKMQEREKGKERKNKAFKTRSRSAITLTFFRVFILKS